MDNEKIQRNLVKSLLLSDGFFTISKVTNNLFGIETALLLSALAEAESMLSDKDGWFYQTLDTLENFTGLTRRRQDRAIKQLEQAGVLTKEVRGIPAKRYFKFDHLALAKLIGENVQTTTLKSYKQESENRTTNKELSNKELSNKELTSTYGGVEPKSKPKAKTKEVDNIPYQEIIEYLNLKAGRKFQVVESNNKYIRQRWSEGNYTIDDFKEVVDKKVNEWGTVQRGKKDLRNYLRPETLFGTKFDSYLNSVDPRQDYQREQEHSIVPSI